MYRGGERREKERERERERGKEERERKNGEREEGRKEGCCVKEAADTQRAIGAKKVEPWRGLEDSPIAAKA